MLIAVIVAGIVILLVVPAESKTAIALAVIACALAAANYAMTPDLDDITKDVKLLREAVETRRPPTNQSAVSPGSSRRMYTVLLGVIVSILILTRGQRK